MAVMTPGRENREYGHPEESKTQDGFLRRDWCLVRQRRSISVSYPSCPAESTANECDGAEQAEGLLGRSLAGLASMALFAISREAAITTARNADGAGGRSRRW